ncbi:hypothetical protein [Paenibacillus odorifer]|uniref:Uncharacterized protein n=1 Tax=Paenibacillus odorifer TaxID=189426 RepID=A0A1R0WSH9_9BACL|nr:hypothetical protein [Paenibacillus odorifer]OMD20357.1 hypothetical protein BJP51_09750 [Paenibacillus odorifer]OMD58166.1 hypothetical protein BSK48_30680 [Paenibacillus odorifer]
MKEPNKILFNGEFYNYEEYEDGSKRIYKEKNSRGFKINIKVSGDPEELKEGMKALKDFYVKGCL